MGTKIITFNVNGFRSILTKAKDGAKLGKTACNDNVITRLLDEIKPDVLCLQEVRCNSNQDISCLNLQARGYEYYTFHCAQKKGYSGTAIIARKKPLNVCYGFIGYDDIEGRSITVEYENCHIINVYVPNSKADLSRLEFRINTWDVMLRRHIEMLQTTYPTKPVILCGDLNVAHENIDVHNPKNAQGSHGFTEEEKASFRQILIQNNMVDAFRNQHSCIREYSWFSPFAHSRRYNKGWRIDYILVQKELLPYVEDTKILLDYYGSDHVPCFISLKSLLI